MTAVASGKLYDYKLMNKIVECRRQTVKQYDSKSKITDISAHSPKPVDIHQGMRMVVEDLHDVFGGFGCSVEVSGVLFVKQHSRLRQDQTMTVCRLPPQ